MKRWICVLLVALAGSVMAAETVRLSFNSVRLPDLLRVVYSDILKTSFVLDDAVLQSQAMVSVDLRALTPDQVADRIGQIIERNGFAVERRGGSYLVGQVKDREESFVYVPAYRSSVWLQELAGTAVKLGRFSSKAQEKPVAAQLSTQGAPGVQAGPGMQQQPAQAAQTAQVDREAIVYAGPANEAANVRKLLEQLDTPSGEVVLKAAVFEVGVKDSEGSALSLAATILRGHLGASLGSVVDGSRLSIRGGGIQAVVSALSQDDRFKVVSKPQVRVRSGGAAKFSVGAVTPVATGAVLDRNGNPVQTIEYRPSGIVLTAKPRVRSGGVELDVTQEVSAYVQTTTGLNTTPTLNQRLVDTSLTMQPGEVVILAGLDQQQESGHSDRLPFLGWLIGQGQERQKTELIMFLEAESL